jgi:hypothetical protein
MDVQRASTSDSSTTTRISGTTISTFGKGILDFDVIDGDNS